MKIISLYIHSFGKLQKFSLNFTDGVNVIERENGFGKTTVANFIRAMLYGPNDNRNKKEYDPLAVKNLQNWGSTDKTGGNMVVEHNGTTYRIERYFGSKDNVFNFLEEKTSKPVKTDLTPGEFLLGLTAESYDRSAYYPQEAVEISTNTNLSTRLSGVVENSDDSYEKVMAKLKDYRLNLTNKSRSGAVIPTLQNRRLQLQRQIEACNAAKNRRRQIDERLEEIAAERQNVSKQIAEREKQADVLQKEIAKAQPSAEQTANAQKLVELKEKLARNADFDKDKATCDQLAQKIAETPEAATVQRKVNKPLLIVGLLLAAAGVGLCFVQIIAGIAALAVGVALAVVSAFINPAVKTLQSGEKDALITQYFAIASKYVFCDGLDYHQVQKALWQAYNDYSGDKRVYAALQNTLSSVNSDVAESENSLQNVRREIIALHQKESALSNEEGRLSAERQGLNDDAISLEEQMDEVNEKLADAQRKVQVVEKTEELLALAKEKLSTSYLPKLCMRCQNLLNQITSGNYELSLDSNFKIQLRVDGATRDVQSFSRGTREIILLCFRVALSELLFGGTLPFLVIDDAFVNFDEANFLRATELLRQISAHAQIIYFTCHDRRGKLQ